MLGKIVIMLMGCIVIAIALPAYWVSNRKGFTLYAIWCAVLLVIWAVLIFGTDAIC